jgi:diketogulonate reductase-like aldo/keto reductase
MGEVAARRKDEVAALELGLDLGITLIDTAEMYAAGAAEEVVAEAIRGRREEVTIVSKVLPENASRRGTISAAERSLQRLGTDRIDLYLLHWPGSHPLAETYAAFERLVEQGKIRHYGVSNFDVDDLEQSEAVPGGRNVAVNQVLYNLTRRGIESGVLPWCRRREVLVMAYSPLEQGRLPRNETLRAVARRRACSIAQAALAWVLVRPGLTVIPKAARKEHVRENAAACDVRLTERDLAELDQAFPAPRGRGPLEIL